MGSSSAFLAEIAVQVRQAQEDLVAARAAGDDDAAEAALGRITDLREIQLEADTHGTKPGMTHVA